MRTAALASVVARTETETGTIAWSIRDVRFQHRGATRAAIDGVTLRVQSGRMTALLGPNGAGKSTLLQLLLGTLTPDRGDVHFGSKPVAAWTRKELALAIGVVPQGETEPLFTVREIVAMGRYPHLGAWQRERAVDIAAIEGAMARCSVAQFAERGLSTLSGGERQRVRLARAIAQEAPVLVLDEPTNSLDVRHEMMTFALLRRLREEGVTVVVATHNLNLAARYADELVLLHAGRVAAHGVAHDVLSSERIEAVYEWPVSIVAHANGAPQIVPCDGVIS